MNKIEARWLEITGEKANNETMSLYGFFRMGYLEGEKQCVTAERERIRAGIEAKRRRSLSGHDFRDGYNDGLNAALAVVDGWDDGIIKS